MEDLNIPDISECSVAEKAHYFEEQIQREMTKVSSKLNQQDSLKSESETFIKTNISDRETIEDDEKYIIDVKDVKKIGQQKEIGTLQMEGSKEDEKKEVKKLGSEDEKDKDESKQVYKEVSDISVVEIFRKKLDEEKRDTSISSKEVLDEVMTEKTDKPEKLKSDIEKSDSTDIVKEIVTERKDQSQKEQEYTEQKIEHKMKSPILTKEKPLRTIKHVEETQVESIETVKKNLISVNEQLDESKGKDLGKQQRKVEDSLETQEVQIGETISEINVKQEVTKERVQDVGVKKKEIQESVVKVSVKQEITKDVEVEKKEVQGPAVKMSMKQEVLHDRGEEEKEIQEPVAEISVKQEIVQDIVTKKKEIQEPVIEVSVKQEIMKDVKEVKQEIIKDVKEVKQEIIKDVKEVKQEIIKDVRDMKQEIQEPVAEISVKQEIIKDVREAKQEIQEPVAKICTKQEIIKDVREAKQEIQEPVAEISAKEEMVQDLVAKKKEIQEPVVEISVKQEIIKDVPVKKQEVPESIAEVSIKQEIMKDVEVKKKETPEPVTEKSVKHEAHGADIDIKQEIMKDVDDKIEVMHEPVSEISIKQEVMKDVEEKEKQEQKSVTEISVHQDVIKDLEKKQEQAQKSAVQVGIKEEVIENVEAKMKDTARVQRDVQQSVTDVIRAQVRPETPERRHEDVVKEKTSGRRIITEETTIIYKVQKDGTLVQEKVLKSVQIGESDSNIGPLSQVPENIVETKIFEKRTSEGLHEIQSISGIKPEGMSSTEIKKEIQKALEGEKKMEAEAREETTVAKQEAVLDKLEQVGVKKDNAEAAEEEKEEDTFITKEESITEADMKLAKKEFESRIPISTAKADKEKIQKEVKRKASSDAVQLPSKSEGEKDPNVESPDVTSPTSKKKEFESRIPKRVVDVKSVPEKPGKKDTRTKKESETYTITEKKSSEEVTSKLEEHSTTKSETQTFSKTFTDPQEALKMFEDMYSAKNDFATVTSKIDHKTSSTTEKKETISSEISSGADKIITLEEKERVEKKKSSESQMKKESPTETLEEKKSKHEELDKTAVQKMSMNLTDAQEVIDATASESVAEVKKEETFKKLSDKEGIMTHETGSSRLRESDADVALRLKKDTSEKTDDDVKTVDGKTGERISKPAADSYSVETIAQGESHKETKESFDVKQFVPNEGTSEEKDSLAEDTQPETSETQETDEESLERKQQQKFKEIEARTIAETLIQSIESEIEAKSAADLKTELLSKGYLEQLMNETTETDHEKLADDLTRKFERIMKKSMDKPADKCTAEQNLMELSKVKSSIHAELQERGSTRDSISISEDITNDEESSPHEKEESFPLSFSQTRLQDRDITISPSSISEPIDFEETIDIDTNELEDMSKSTLSTQSEKQRSDKSSSQLQQQFHSDANVSQDKVASEVSGARVLEILEPGMDSQSRQDSVDVPSLEMDEHKLSEQTSRGISSLHETGETDLFERIAHERDITISPSTVSEDMNIDYSLVQEPLLPLTIQKEHELVSAKRADSFEIESPPLISPKSKVHGLEIPPVNWMIGDEKIEISETLQPSQIFNQELEAYESQRKQERISSQDGSTDYEQESGTKSSEDVSVIESVKETVTDDSHVTPSIGKGTKFTVIPISEQDFESELVENKLDVSCQELVDTLQREYDAKTPTKEYVENMQREIFSAQDVELEKKEEEESVKEETQATEERTDAIQATELGTEQPPEEISKEPIKGDVSLESDNLKTGKDEQKVTESVTRPDVELKLEKTTMSSKEPDESVRVDDVLKEWTETYLSKMKPLGEEYKRHMEKTIEKHDKPGRSTTVPSDTCAFKIKKDDLSSVDLSARYAITVLDQVVKKEIAEVKESLEAAKQDLIEELNENSETVIQIEDSPSEFQFKLQPESIPNDLPFLYKPVSPEQMPERDTETTKSESPVAKPVEQEPSESKMTDTIESKVDVEEHTSGSAEEPIHVTRGETPVIKTEKSDVETAVAVHEDTKDDEDERPSPVPASRSGSDIDNKDESSSLALPRPVIRRRQKPGRTSRRVASESEADVGSSSGDSSNYQSCDYDIGSGSRPSSSDIEALQSCGLPSGTASEYETAMTSIEHSTSSKPTSQEYHTAATTMSSRESMKSLASLSSGHLGSIDSTSELSETLVPSETDVEKEYIDDKDALDDEQSDSSGSDMPIDETVDKIDSHVPCRMKRSSEMIFPQVLDEDAAIDAENADEKDAKGIDSATSTLTPAPGTLQSVDIMTARISEDGIQSVCTQVISTQATPEDDSPAEKLDDKAPDMETVEKDTETAIDAQMTEPDLLERKYSASGVTTESPEMSMQTSIPSMMQQTSMSTSSTSGVSIDTVVEKEKLDRHSPDSDSFEIVDKPDIIDDFIVIEEVGREAEEYDSEGKSIRISAVPQVTSKNYDRDLENLITETKEDSQVSTSQTSRTNELFEFESEESPPQASNDDQYSQSYSDEEQCEENKKWIEMQFHVEGRVYEIEYDRGPLEDIKEEEITDFEAGSSRFGSLGSHKESIGSVGSMRGSLGSTPDYDVLAGRKYFTRPSDHDNVSLSSLQEFENLESAVAAENSKKLQQCGSHDSVNNGSLPRRYVTSRSGHGDDVSLSSLKDFEGLEKACREAHLIELRAREEEDLLEHESPENKYKLENIPRARVETSIAGSFNPSTSGSDDYEKRIKEIDEIIRIAQSNVEKFDRQDDTTEDISQIEITDVEKVDAQVATQSATKQEDLEEAQLQKENNVMETSTDSLELEDNMDKKHHPLCRSSDSLDMKTTLDVPSLSSDSLNNVRDAKETQLDMTGHPSSVRRISSDSLDMPLLEQQDVESQERGSENGHSDGAPSDNSLEQRSETTETDVRSDKMKTLPSADT